MQFNLRHFVYKRRLTLMQWAENNNLKSIEDYDSLMLNKEFVNDLSIREELEKEFLVAKQIPVEISVLSTTEDLEKPAEILELPPAEATEDKPAKKKRSKTEPEVI